MGIYRVASIQAPGMFKWDNGIVTNLVLPSPPLRFSPSVSDGNNSGQIVGASFDAEAAQVWQRLRCLDCEAVWTAVYALQGYADLERPGMIPQEEQARLLREVLLNRNLNPYDVLDLAAGVEAALLVLPAIQEHIQAAWEEEHQRAAEETEDREEP